MERYQREIILIDQFHINMNQFFDKSREVYFLDPVELFSKIDWRLFEEDAKVTNIVYKDLCDAVVINHKKSVRY